MYSSWMQARCLAFSFLIAVFTAWKPTPAASLALDPFLSPSPDTDEKPGVLALTNDSFGPGPVDEWDDLDSFGIRFSAPVGQARLLAAISGLTDRGSTPSEASRIDEASLGAAWYLVSGAPVWFSLAAGLDAIGDFGGLSIQETFHGDTGVGRPVPAGYSSGFGLAPLAGFKLTLSSAEPWSPYAIIAGRGSIPARGSLLAVGGLRYARPGVLVAVGAGWRSAGGAAPDATLAVLDQAENGPYLGFEMRVGLLDLLFEDVPHLKKTNGALGIVLGEPPRAADPDARPLSLDLGLVTGSAVAQRVRLAVGIAGARQDLRGEVFLGFAQGWFASDHPDETGTLFAEYGAGGAISLPIAHGPISVEAGLGPYLSFEQLSTVTLALSAPLGYRDCLGLEAEAGIRVLVPTKRVPLGLGWRLRWRALEAAILQTHEAFPQRGAFDFEVFITSSN